MTALVLASILACAQGTKAQPPQFTVDTADGVAVTSTQVLGGSRRVLVYVAPNSEPAVSLIRELRKWSDSSPERWHSRVVVIIAAPRDKARDWLRSQWDGDNLPVWFADPDAQGWRALGFSGTLGIAGIADGSVDWKLDGVLADPGAVQPTISAWVEAGDPRR
jgi:hypothetical protein